MLPTFWKRLIRRWFVEYNPLYLLSATCVLLGVNKLSAALAHSPSGGIAVTAIAELYAWALIGGAALLKRAELNRPAVMLVLLAAVYQCDPTLHTETCAYFPGGGVLEAVIWLASFSGKLYGMAWALRIRLSVSALCVPSFAALGVIVIPRLSRDYDPKNLTSLVALWLFSVFAIALSSSRRITCASSLDAWGRTVLRRTTMAIWYIWTALLLAHVWFWATEFDLNLFVLVPVALLLRTRVARSERETWASVAGALAVGALLPTYFSMFAGMACIALVLSILRQPSPAPIEALVPNDAPDLDSREEDVAVFSSFVVAQPAARARFFAGSIFAVYLCWWTRPWTGGALPAHALVLDLSLTTALLFMFWKTRRVAPLTALFAAYLHLGVATGVIFVPRTQMHWAIVYLGLGFGLLLTSLVASLWFLRTDSTADNSGVSND